jgi:DNA-binding phage protein
MGHFDHTYGRPVVREMSDEGVMDEAVGIEIGDTALTEWMSDADAEYIQAVMAEAERRGLMERVRELAYIIREAEYIERSRYSANY